LDRSPAPSRHLEEPERQAASLEESE